MQHGPVALITTTVLVSAGLISLCTSSSSSSLPQQDEGRPPARRGRFCKMEIWNHSWDNSKKKIVLLKHPFIYTALLYFCLLVCLQWVSSRWSRKFKTTSSWGKMPISAIKETKFHFFFMRTKYNVSERCYYVFFIILKTSAFNLQVSKWPMLKQWEPQRNLLHSVWVLQPWGHRQRIMCQWIWSLLHM